MCEIAAEAASHFNALINHRIARLFNNLTIMLAQLGCTHNLRADRWHARVAVRWHIFVSILCMVYRHDARTKVLTQ